ncbi:MAG: hypothetical protein VYB54_16425 [Pseudomonadota bacterium]|nr:hypothetical protein [Pseudomonadota bacterium]
MDPVHLLLPAAALMLLGLLAWAAGGRWRRGLDRDAIRAAVALEGHRAGTILLADDRRAALVWLDDMTAIATIGSVGTHPVVSVIRPGEIAEIGISGPPSRLWIRRHGPGHTRFSMRLTDPATLDRWRKVLMLFGELPADPAIDKVAGPDGRHVVA